MLEAFGALDDDGDGGGSGGRAGGGAIRTFEGKVGTRGYVLCMYICICIWYIYISQPPLPPLHM